MKYLIIFLVWCLASLVGIATMVFQGTYNIVYMVHFFSGLSIILIFGFFETALNKRRLTLLGIKQ